MNELNPFKLAKMLEELENTVELHSISVRYKGEKVVEGAWAPFSMEEAADAAFFIKDRNKYLCWICGG